MAIERLPFSEPLKEGASLNGDLRELVEELFRLGITLKETRAEIERLFIEKALKEYNGNRSRVARRLGLHRNTLNKKIEHYGLSVEPRT